MRALRACSPLGDGGVRGGARRSRRPHRGRPVCAGGIFGRRADPHRGAEPGGERSQDRVIGAGLPARGGRAAAIQTQGGALRGDGSVGCWNRVYSQDLDRLSLRLRAVEAMLPLDKGKARELFLQIPAPATPPLTCEEFQVYDVSRFYDVLGRSPGVFWRQGNGGGRIVPVAAAICRSRDFPRAGRANGACAGRRQSDGCRFPDAGGILCSSAGQSDWRRPPFAYSAAVGKEILAVVEESKRRHLSPLLLLEAYRVLLVIHLSGNRCADDDLMKGSKTSFGVFSTQQAEEASADFVGFFNEKLRMPPLQPIRNWKPHLRDSKDSHGVAGLPGSDVPLDRYADPRAAAGSQRLALSAG